MLGMELTKGENLKTEMEINVTRDSHNENIYFNIKLISIFFSTFRTLGFNQQNRIINNMRLSIIPSENEIITEEV